MPDSKGRKNWMRNNKPNKKKVSFSIFFFLKGEKGEKRETKEKEKQRKKKERKRNKEVNSKRERGWTKVLLIFSFEAQKKNEHQ